MQIRFRNLTPLAFILLAGCPDNDLAVGAVDAAPSNPANTGGTGGATTGGAGGASSPSTGGVGGTGGLSGSAGGGYDGGIVQDVPGGGGGCDPFAPVPKPIALGSVLGVGRSADGTIYVADQSDNTQRVFVSDASSTLVRQHVDGSGSSSDASGLMYIFAVSDPVSPFVLEIEIPDAGAMRIGVLPGTLKDRKDFVIGQEGEELTVLPSSAIAGMPVRNLPGTITAEYVATLPDGELLLVTRPTDDATYADYRLFFGPTTAVVERAVTSFVRYRDGGTTNIVFDLDGAEATAYFGRVDGGVLGPATLTVAGVTTPLTRQSTPPAATYVCL